MSREGKVEVTGMCTADIPPVNQPKVTVCMGSPLMSSPGPVVNETREDQAVIQQGLAHLGGTNEAGEKRGVVRLDPMVLETASSAALIFSSVT